MGDTSFWYPSCLAHSINTTFSFSSSVVGQPIFSWPTYPGTVCVYIYVQLLMGIYLYILDTIHIYYVHLYTIHVHIFFSAS